MPSPLRGPEPVPVGAVDRRPGRAGQEIHVHHWFRAVSEEGHTLWLCRCGLMLDWSAVRDAWDAEHETGRRRSA